MADLNLPDDPKLAGKLIDSRMKQEETRLQQGRLGTWIGGRDHAPHNIAFLALVFFALLLASLILFWDGTPEFSKRDGILLIANIVTLVLGYVLGGRGNKP